MKRTFTSVLALIMVVCMMLTPVVQASASAPEDVTLKVGIHGDTGGYDPATGTSGTPQQVIKPTYRGLFSVAADGSLKNELCESYTVSDDGLVYTFKLRTDAKWSDGVAITANDFVYGWQRNLDPTLAVAYSDLLAAVVNFEPCFTGEKPIEEFGVKALDENTFEVTLAYTEPYFVQKTTFSPFFPVREDLVPRDDSGWSINNVDQVVTSGPFKFESYSQNEKVVLVRNPEYYAPEELGNVTRIEFYFMDDAQTSVAAFKNGELDIAVNVPSDVSATHDNANEVMIAPYLVSICYVFTGFNEVGDNGSMHASRNRALEDVRVRQAINMAIDRDMIVEVLQGNSTALYGIIPYGITNPATGADFRTEGGDLVTYDVEKAQALLAEAGYPNGEGIEPIVWLSSNNQRNSDIAVMIQAQLKQNLGIDLELHLLESQAFSADRRAGNFDICALGTSADYNDPTTWLSLYDSSTSYIIRVAGYSTPEYDELLQASNLEMDPAKRFEMLHEAERILLQDDSQWIPVMTYDQPLLVKEYVKNVVTTAAGDIYVFGASIEK